MARAKKNASTSERDNADNSAQLKEVGRSRADIERDRLAKSHATRRARAKGLYEKFLTELAIERSVSKACEAIGKSRSFVYDEKDRNPAFSKEWDDILETVKDDLEAGAMKRAIEGWLEPQFFKGTVIGSVRRYSAALTIFMLKCHRPDRYNLFHADDDGSQGTPEERARKTRDALGHMRSSVPTSRDDSDSGDGDGGDV